MKLLLAERPWVALNSLPGVDGATADLRVVGFDGALVELVGDLLEEFLRFEVEGMVAGEAKGLRGRRRVATPRAVVRRDAGRLLGLDVDAVDAGELPVAVLRKDADVSGGDTRAADPAVMVLDVGLIQVPAREEGGAAFAEVRGRDRVLDAGTRRALAQRLVDHVVADGFGSVQLRPERVIVGAGMVGEPAVDVRDARDERDRATANLPLDGDLQAVVVVLDVADGEAFELPTPEPGVELEGDHGRVAAVERGLDHRDDVLLPVEHVPRVGRGVVVARRPGGDPFETLRVVVARLDLADLGAEDTECDSVVPVRLLVVVGVVDPLDDDLGCLTVFQGRRDATDLFGRDDEVSEQLLVAVAGDGRPAEVELPVEGGQHVSITVGDVLGGIDTLSEGFDAVLWGHAALESARGLSCWCGCEPQFPQPTRSLKQQVQSLYPPGTADSVSGGVAA